MRRWRQRVFARVDRAGVAACLSAACCLLIGGASAAAPPVAPQGLQALRDLPGRAEVRVQALTGAARFVRFGKGGPPQFAARRGRSPRRAAAEFLAAHKSAFGLTDPAAELSAPALTIDPYRHAHVRYHQRHRGLKVFGGRLRVHFNERGDLFAVSGNIIPDIRVSAVPGIGAAEAEAVAVQLIRKQSKGRPGWDSLAASGSELLFFRAGLVRRVAGENHLVYAVDVVNAEWTIREIVFVDAHSGAVVEHYNRIADALSRRVSETSVSNVVWTEGNPDPIPAGWAGGTAQQVGDWQNEIDGAGETYNLIANLTGAAWRSYDGADAQMRTVNNDPNIACPNANWNGVTSNYCSDVTGDDTVAHEWGHAYTEYTHGLIYAWQPGALNEAYSDIWGEIVDLANGRGSDAPGGLRSAGACSTFGSGSPSTDNSYRWLSGEDDPAFGGAIRDLWHPNCYGDPGKVSDSQYWCSSGDSGGVHTNSGVPNHAFALIVDGGSYNGQSVAGIGLTKAAHIYWYAQTQFQTPVSGFEEHADALEASCSALVGVPLNALNTASVSPVVSGEVISSGDCDQVIAAVAAIELRTPPDQCSFQPLLASPAPPLCDGLGAVLPFSDNDWETGLAGWTVTSRDVANPASFAAVGNWQVVGDLPAGRSGSAAFGPDPVIGDCAADDISGILILESPDMLIPAGAEVPRVAFDHWLATEDEWDGGNVKLSLNGGPFSLLPASRLSFNSYSDNLATAAAGNTNPLQGEPAFNGSDGGSVTGSWGQTQISLYTLAAPGDTIRLRFELGLDGCNGMEGWYIDDVQAYSCAAEQAPVCGDGAVAPGETCDDGNPDAGDGCSSACLVEPGYACEDPFVGQADVVADGSFEAGSPNPFWTGSSINFGIPLCTLALCGGPGASDGDWFIWFGGIAAYETALMAQNVVIPSAPDSATLAFDLLVGVCDSSADYVEVIVDGDVVYHSGACTPNGAYQRIQVDLSAYADGATHGLGFHAESFSTNGGWANFFVDNVTLNGGPVLNLPSVCQRVAPVIQIDPPDLIGIIDVGGGGSLPLHIANVGADGLHWNLTEDDIPAAAAPVAIPQRGPGRAVVTSRQAVGPPVAGAHLGTAAVGAADPATRRRTPPAAAPLGSIALSQSLAGNVTQGNSVSCNNDVNHVDNRYYRVFDLDAFGIGAPMQVSSVGIAVEEAIANSGSQPVTVNLYLLDGDFLLANLTPIGTNTISQPNAAVVAVDVPISADVPAGSRLVVEVFTPDGAGDGGFFFIGSNAGGQTAPSYLQAPGCGIDEPTDLADLGFPGMHIVMTVRGSLASACQPVSEIPWASAAPISGTLASGASETVNVSIDASGLALGSYDATLCIDSNDTMNPLLEVPLTLVVSADPDQDGIDSSVEDAGPNGGDGNGDGVPDRIQPDVVTLVIGSAQVTVTNDDGCDVTIDIASDTFGVADPGFIHPQGIVGFTLSGCGGTPVNTTVTILYHDLANPSAEDIAKAVFREIIPGSSSWYTFPFRTFGAVDIDGAGLLPPVLSVDLWLLDGYFGDSPLGVINGLVVDLGALAYAVWPPAAAIPALSHRALLLLLLLMLAASRVVRRRSPDCGG